MKNTDWLVAMMELPVSDAHKTGHGFARLTWSKLLVEQLFETRQLVQKEGSYCSEYRIPVDVMLYVESYINDLIYKEQKESFFDEIKLDAVSILNSKASFKDIREVKAQGELCVRRDGICLEACVNQIDINFKTAIYRSARFSESAVDLIN